MTDLLTARTWGRHALADMAGLRNRTLEKSELTLVRALLAAWILNLGVLAGFLLKYNSVAAFSLGGAIAAALGAGIALNLRHRRQHHAAIRWRVLLPMALAHAVFLSVVAWLMLMPGRGFVIENFALYQVDPFSDGTARFAALSELPDGQTFLSSIDALVLLKLRNDASDPKVIRDYAVEAWTGSGWQPLCPVTFAPNPPYYLFTRARAREVVLTPLALKGPETAIAPRQASTFWSAWSCPQKCDLAATPLRLAITDRNAQRQTALFPSDHKADGVSLPSGLDIGGGLDLDVAKEKLYGRKNCADQISTRRRRGATLW